MNPHHRLWVVRASGWTLAWAWAAAQAVCHPQIAPTRPDSRYEAVTGSQGAEVRDKVTGLVWQRCVLGMVWDGSRCTGTARTLTWLQALQAARSAPASPVKGAGAWRVPSLAELYSLAERACHTPAINAHWFPNTPTDNPWTWSSSPAPQLDEARYAWAVHFNNGADGWDGKDDIDYNVRLVRSDAGL